FLEKFPIPEEERLPVVDTPITEREFELLEFAYRNVKLPVVDLQRQPPMYVRHRIQLYDATTGKYKIRPTMLHAASDDTNTPSEVLKNMMQTNGTTKVKDKEVFIETQLDDSWKLNLEIECDIPVERVRLGKIPAFRNVEEGNRWNVELKMFADKIRREFLEQPLFVQLSNGYCIKCFLPFP
ncbi:MAG: hypothetical protein LBI18_04985, partial [Planctomycetaceae bacterium]|nr:hypothetical protein [Planctomycetaceae bacterium]